jgi:hypothetical protein
LAAPPSVDFAAANLPGERHGLQLVDPFETGGSPPPPAERRLRPFDWGLLAGFAAVQIAHLAGLALVARWALRRLIGI